MSTPFDQIAPAYADLWSDTAKGRGQREEVWRSIDPLFPSGSRVLDLGCGTGEDAVHLAERGVIVTGIDASAAMVEEARKRGADARILPIEKLHEIEGRFEGCLSNFGALNCVADLRAVSESLARIVTPGSLVALCVLSRHYAREWLSNPWRALKRLQGRVTWRGITIYYRSEREIRNAFSPHFRWALSQPIGGGDHTLIVLRRST